MIYTNSIRLIFLDLIDAINIYVYVKLRNLFLHIYVSFIHCSLKIRWSASTPISPEIQGCIVCTANGVTACPVVTA